MVQHRQVVAAAAVLVAIVLITHRALGFLHQKFLVAGHPLKAHLLLLLELDIQLPLVLGVLVVEQVLGLEEMEVILFFLRLQLPEVAVVAYKEFLLGPGLLVVQAAAVTQVALLGPELLVKVMLVALAALIILRLIRVAVVAVLALLELLVLVVLPPVPVVKAYGRILLAQQRNVAAVVAVDY